MNTANLKYLLLILTITITNSCNTKKEMGPNETKFKNIPNTIEQYNETPLFYINRSTLRTNGNIEVLINDIPIIQDFVLGGGRHKITNQYLLKTGKQKVEMRYTAIKNQPYRKDFNGHIYIYRKEERKGYVSDGKQLINYDVPRDNKSQNNLYGDFVGAGLMAFKDSITFEATVPYNLVGWSESKDLSKMDKDDLLKETVEAYQSIIDMAKTKNREALFGLYYNAIFEISQSEFLNEKWFKKYSEGLDFILENETVEFLPIENFELKTYGYGKVVALESLTNKGISALQFKLTATDKRTSDRVSGTSNMRVLLHKPKGSNKLVPIR